jgi:hypothetical protein
LPVDAAIEAVVDYLKEICRTDIGEVDGIRRDPAKVRRLLRVWPAISPRTSRRPSSQPRRPILAQSR